MEESAKTITVDAFAEATIGAVMRASDARRARLASAAASAPASAGGTTDPAAGLAGIALAAAGYPIVVYGIIAGPGWPWGGVAGGALAGLGGATGASSSTPSGGTPVAGE